MYTIIDTNDQFKTKTNILKHTKGPYAAFDQ